MVSSQDKILSYCLKNCVFDGWTNKLLTKACKNAGLEKDYWKIPFPNGSIDVIDYYTEKANTEMLKGIKLEGLKTTEKVRALIINRLKIYENEKEVIRSCIAVYMLLPHKGLQASFRSADAIWRAAGDTATDWNFYTKRGLLAKVYLATIMYWLDDKSENHQASWEFLDRRLSEVAKLGKFLAKFK